MVKSKAKKSYKQALLFAFTVLKNRSNLCDFNNILGVPYAS